MGTPLRGSQSAEGARGYRLPAPGSVAPLRATSKGGDSAHSTSAPARREEPTPHLPLRDARDHAVRGGQAYLRTSGACHGALRTGSTVVVATPRSERARHLPAPSPLGGCSTRRTFSAHRARTNVNEMAAGPRHAYEKTGRDRKVSFASAPGGYGEHGQGMGPGQLQPLPHCVMRATNGFMSPNDPVP